MKTLQALFRRELACRYDAELRLTRALPKMATIATCTHLQNLIKTHLAAVKGHVKKLDEVFASFGTEAEGETSEATEGILMEGDEIAESFEGSPAINAALVSTLQKIGHFGVSSCSTMEAWARLLGDDEAAALLLEILESKQAAIKELSELADERSNPQALGETHGEETGRLMSAELA